MWLWIKRVKPGHHLLHLERVAHTHAVAHQIAGCGDDTNLQAEFGGSGDNFLRRMNPTTRHQNNLDSVGNDGPL